MDHELCVAAVFIAGAVIGAGALFLWMFWQALKEYH